MFGSKSTVISACCRGFDGEPDAALFSIIRDTRRLIEQTRFDVQDIPAGEHRVVRAWATASSTEWPGFFLALMFF
jgi:hypothetical protein